MAKTAVLWPKTAPAQVPLAPAKTPLRRPEKATGRVALTTPPRAAEHAKAIRTHAGGRLRALRVAASLRSGPLACLWRRGGHSQAREWASCSSRAAHQPAEKTSIDLVLALARDRGRARGWVTAAACRVTRRPTWRAGAACRSCRVAVACVPCRLPTWRVGCCYSTWGARADPRVAARGCLSPSLRARRAACGVTVASQPPLGGPRTPSGTSSARASRRSGEAVALRVLVSTLLSHQPAAPPY